MGMVYLPKMGCFFVMVNVGKYTIYETYGMICGGYGMICGAYGMPDFLDWVDKNWSFTSSIWAQQNYEPTLWKWAKNNKTKGSLRKGNCSCFQGYPGWWFSFCWCFWRACQILQFGSGIVMMSEIAWHTHGNSGWSKKTGSKTFDELKCDVFSLLGHIVFRIHTREMTRTGIKARISGNQTERKIIANDSTCCELRMELLLREANMGRWRLLDLLLNLQECFAIWSHKPLPKTSLQKAVSLSNTMCKACLFTISYFQGQSLWGQYIYGFFSGLLDVFSVSSGYNDRYRHPLRSNMVSLTRQENQDQWLLSEAKRAGNSTFSHTPLSNPK